MSKQYEDFIGIYRNVYPDGYCEHLISEFERLTKDGAGATRQDTEGAARHEKDDFQLGFNVGVHASKPFEGMSATSIFFNGLQRCYEDYSDCFSALKNVNLRATHMKMQRTDPGGGYHLWHHEQGNKEQATRALSYMLYLNTLTDKEGGETEFLYQRKRIAPEVNTMLLWPAAYTHTHRGNLVLGEQSKYIVTGWFYYEC